MGITMKTVYIYLFDTFSDWEIGYVLELFSWQNKLSAPSFQVRTVGAEKRAYRSLCGVTVLPDCALNEIDECQMAALLLPGGYRWGEAENAPVLDLAQSCLQKGVVVGAICGATLALAERGCLNDRAHTSNMPEYLLSAKAYTGQARYVAQKAARDKNLVTAGAAGGLEWAKLIAQALSAYPQEALENWYRYYASANAEYFLKFVSYIQSQAKN